jgi:hypothetical protein
MDCARVANGASAATVAADAVQDLLTAVVYVCVSGTRLLDRVHVGVLGYGAGVRSRLLGEVAEPVVRVSAIMDACRLEDGQPVWVEARTGGDTYVIEGLDSASRALTSWHDAHPLSPPPFLVHITAGLGIPGSYCVASEHAQQLLTSTPDQSCSA